MNMESECEKCGSKNCNGKVSFARYTVQTGIVIYCKWCGADMDETGDGYYSPIEYYCDKYNRTCTRCRNSL